MIISIVHSSSTGSQKLYISLRSQTITCSKSPGYGLVATNTTHQPSHLATPGEAVAAIVAGGLSGAQRWGHIEKLNH